MELGLKVETAALRNYHGTYKLKTKIIRLASPELIVLLISLHMLRMASCMEYGSNTAAGSCCRISVLL